MWHAAGVSEQAEPEQVVTPATGHEKLLAEAAAKSGLVWLRPAVPGAPGTGRAWPAWHVWQDGAVLVVSGAGEQQLPELAGEVEVLVRSKDSGGRLLTVRAVAATLDPDDDAWPTAAQALAASRLNSTHSPAELPGHWRSSGARITRLVAHGEPLESPGRYDSSSGAAAPVPSPATTSGWRPWHAGGRGRRALRRLRRARRLG